MSAISYKVLSKVGFTPWEGSAEQARTREQISAMFDREEDGREPPYGPALDLGCGGGLWSIELARRGWQVTGVDIVPKALRIARERAQGAGVNVRFVQGDLAALRAAEVGSGYRLLLDFGAVHGLKEAQRRAAGSGSDRSGCLRCNLADAGVPARTSWASSAWHESCGDRGRLPRVGGRRGRGARRRVAEDCDEGRPTALVPAHARVIESFSGTASTAPSGCCQRSGPHIRFPAFERGGAELRMPLGSAPRAWRVCFARRSPRKLLRAVVARLLGRKA